MVDQILQWFAGRKHKIAFAAVDKQRFQDLNDDDVWKKDLKDEWNAAAFHIVLSIQRFFAKEKGNKGNTLFVFDRGKPPTTLIDLILNPPNWSDTYYEREQKQERLDKIVDIPFYADSHNIQLIQIADLVCYILRRFADINDYGQAESYSGELQRYDGWINIMKNSFIPKSHRYRKQKPTDTSQFFKSLAPECLIKL